MAISTKPKPKPQPHHKKRQALHHRRGKHYVSSYWPFLPILAIIFIGIGANNLLSHKALLGASSDYSQETLLAKTNEQREVAKEVDLTIDPRLTTAAQAKASDMAARNYWAHNTPDGKAPWAFFATAGYNYELAGENLAYGFNGADETVAAWMNSPGHRANILNAGYQQVGFGVVTTPSYQGHGEETIVVAEYGKPSTSVATIRFSVPGPSSVAGASLTPNKTEPADKLVSRLQLLHDGQPTWSTLVVTVLATLAAITFIIKHGLYLRRVFMKGELYVVHHPILDIAIVALATVGFVLTRTSGFLR